MKKIFSGKESSGKSLMLAKTATIIVERNSKWFKTTNIERPIYSNLKFSEDFVSWAESKNVPIKYWKQLDELTVLDNADIIFDEVGSYLDSRMWADLSLNVRRWLAQCAKVGIHIYGSAQDFAQVDKSFRRLTNQLIEITKICGSARPMKTAPSSNKIWGVCLVKNIDPNGYEEDKKKFAGGLPSFFFIQKKYCEIFDTTQKIDKAKLPPLKHDERYCEHHPDSGGDGSCRYCKVLHN